VHSPVAGVSQEHEPPWHGRGGGWKAFPRRGSALDPAGQAPDTRVSGPWNPVPNVGPAGTHVPIQIEPVLEVTAVVALEVADPVASVLVVAELVEVDVVVPVALPPPTPLVVASAVLVPAPPSPTLTNTGFVHDPTRRMHAAKAGAIRTLIKTSLGMQRPPRPAGPWERRPQNW
jgi:hypothetical protein